MTVAGPKAALRVVLFDPGWLLQLLKVSIFFALQHRKLSQIWGEFKLFFSFINSSDFSSCLFPSVQQDLFSLGMTLTDRS